MGRFAELCGEVAAEADTGPDGLILPGETWARLRESGWNDDDVMDALEVVHANFIHLELIEAADSLSARLVEILGAFAEDAPFAAATAGKARLPIELIGQIVRRVAHLERVLDPLREGSPVDRTAFDRLERRLADQGLEAALRLPRPARPSRR